MALNIRGLVLPRMTSLFRALHGVFCYRGYFQSHRLGAFTPQLPGMLLHVGLLVFLVHDFQAKQCFQYVLQRYDAFHAAILVNDYHDVKALVQECFKCLGYRGPVLQRLEFALVVT